MKLGFIFFIGIFANILLASIFPYQLLPGDVASDLVGDDVFPYQFGDSEYLGGDTKDSSSTLYTTMQDNSQTNNLLSTNQQETSIIESVSFFDGLKDALDKITTYISLILPFGTLLGLLPGAIGLILQILYTGVVVYAIGRFIRGV